MPPMPETPMITSPPRYTIATSPISDIGSETIRPETILSIPESETPLFKIRTVEEPLDLTMKKTCRNEPNPSALEMKEATDYLETLLNTEETPRIVSVERVMNSPASADTDEYRYIEDNTPTKDESDHTGPPTTENNNPPDMENEPANQLNEDLEVSDTDTSSYSTASSTDEVRTRRARFKALFYVDDIGDHTTEIRMRTPKMYNCSQS